MQTYTYDANGNRLTKTQGGTATTYTNNNGDQLTSDGTSTYSHDLNGNLTARGTDTFAWDHASRMTVGGTAATYAYDGADTRVSKSVSGTPTTYLWHRESGLAFLVDDGSDAYLHAGGLIGEVAGSSREELLGDGLGSVRGVRGSTGTLAGTRDFDAFGAPRTTTGATSNFAFTGEQLDAETGFEYRRARYYDPTLGRFTSADTVIPNAPGTRGWNLYAYVAGNPTTWTDPTGHLVERPALDQVVIGATTATAGRIIWHVVITRMVQNAIEIIVCYLTGPCRQVAETITKSRTKPNEDDDDQDVCHKAARRAFWTMSTAQKNAARHGEDSDSVIKGSGGIKTSRWNGLYKKDGDPPGIQALLKQQPIANAVKTASNAFSMKAGIPPYCEATLPIPPGMSGTTQSDNAATMMVVRIFPNGEIRSAYPR